MPESRETANAVDNSFRKTKLKGTYFVIFLLVFLLFGGVYLVYQGKHTVAYAVELEANPAVELELNKNGLVLQANGVNEEGICLLHGLDVRNQDGMAAADALVGAMLKQGDLSAEKNSLLLTVRHDNPAKQAEMQERFIKEIKTVLQENAVKAAVLSPDLNDETQVQQMADSLQITAGKMAIIQQIIAQDNQLQAADLAELSINDLGLILDSFNPESSQIEVRGGSSEKEYIGHEKAFQLACIAAGVNQDRIEDFAIDFDVENGRMMYEVEFMQGAIEYSYDLDAVDGTVIGQKQKKKQTNRLEQQAAISHGEALTAAVKQAGMAETQVQVWKNHLQEEDGLAVYDVEFADDAYVYEYTVDARRGSILEDKRKQLQTVINGTQDTGNSSGGNQAGSATDIGENQAKTLALQHANLAEAEVQKLKVKHSYEHGYKEYEVEFHAGRVEYEYKIDAATGDILELEQDA